MKEADTAHCAETDFLLLAHADRFSFNGRQRDRDGASFPEDTYESCRSPGFLASCSIQTTIDAETLLIAMSVMDPDSTPPQPSFQTGNPQGLVCLQ